MKTIDQVRDDLGAASQKIDEAIGRATSAGRQDIAAVLLEAGESVDAAIDDLSQIDHAPGAPSAE